MSIHRLTIVLAIAATICGGTNAQSPIKCATNKQCETPDTGLACIHNTCGQCNTTTNQTTNPCGSTHVCAFDMDQAIHTCKRAPLFSKATPVSTWFGVVFLFMGSALAAGGGLGGGGIFVPLLILVATLSPKEAVPISQAMIFGGSLVNLYINYHSRHPTVKTRPLIDYDAVLILEPLMLLGTTIGVMLNTICPTWLIVVILVVVIGYGAIRTTKKGIRKFNQERALRAAVASRKQEGIEMTEQVAKKDGNDGELSMPIESKENSHGPMMTRMGKGTMISHRPKDDMCVIELEWKLANNAKVFMYTKYSTVESGNTSVNNIREPNVSASKDVVVGVDVEATDALQRQKTLIVERESTQNSRLLMVMGMLILIVVLSLIRGGKAGAASVVGIETCSGGNWGVTIALFLVLIILAVVVGTTLKSQYDAKIACKYTFVEGDIEWTGRNVYLYPALSAFAGMCGGLLGIGGGMIMGPLLLELKMLPECTQATSATTVMITSGAAMFQFLFLGMLIPDYGLAFTIVGFIATFFGQTALNYLVKKYNTTSFIVFSIALVMIIAVLLMAVAGIIRIVDEVENGGGGFSSMC